MIKTFDLYKTMFITTIVAIVVALLFQIDYSGAASISSMWQDYSAWIEAPFEWTHGNYCLVLVLIVVYGKK